MFLLMGISNEQIELQHDQMAVCERCGRYGRYIVYMTCTLLSLFFLPVCRWGRRYFVRMSCCGTTYQLDPEIGKRIAKGENVEILPEHLTPVDGPGRHPHLFARYCTSCGYATNEDFDYCPRCGKKF